jgi:hypothetical protein
MATPWTADERNKVLAAIIKRASSDENFRRCLSNPAKAVEVAGKPLPAGFRLQFVDNKGSNTTVVLPDLRPAGNQLTDEDLEEVAGGGRCSTGSYAMFGWH